MLHDHILDLVTLPHSANSKLQVLHVKIDSNLPIKCLLKTNALLKYLLLILMSYRGKVKELQRLKNDPVLKKIYFFAK